MGVTDKSPSIIQAPFQTEDNTVFEDSSLTSFEEYASNETTATSKQKRTEYKSRFIRYNGGHSTGTLAMPNRIRMSKSMKRMFKNVFKYQMNAISSLEKFYESQVYKLETDRRKNLALNPENSEFIIKFYDKQLEELEERVYCNLTYICRNRCDGSCVDSTHDSSGGSSGSFKRQLSLPFKHKALMNRKKFQSSSSIKKEMPACLPAYNSKILTNGSLKLSEFFNQVHENCDVDFTDGFISFNSHQNGLPLKLC
jgi:hypothetical protein